MSTDPSTPNVIKLTCQCTRKLVVPAQRLGTAAPCPACRHSVRTVGRRLGPGIYRSLGCLVIRGGPHSIGEQLFLCGDKPISVGKSETVDVRLPGERVSRKHCELLATSQGWRIEDRGSTNGVVVNNVRTKAHDLAPGDRVRIGEYELEYAQSSPRGESAPRADVPLPTTEQLARSPLGEPDDDGPYRIAAEPDTWNVPAAGEPIAGAALSINRETDELRAMGDSPSDAGPTVRCPSCKQPLPAKSKICVRCGIDLKTGRSLITSQESGLDGLYETAESTIRWCSWIVPVGIFPISSEAFGTRKPYAIRTLTIITILISCWYFYYLWVPTADMSKHVNLMLWVGSPNAARNVEPPPQFDDDYDAKPADPNGDDAEEFELREPAMAVFPESYRGAHYQPAQLITHAFLHGDLLHLAGNLVFLLVFGTRINAMIGNVATLLFYPLLAIGAAVAEMASMSAEPLTPTLGASGAVMGLAGMYFVFAPVHLVHMAAWARWGLVAGFHLSLRMWAMRGFWVVLFYISFDVVYTILNIEDNVAHWAHLGGFLVGAAIAIVLLLTRLVTVRGGDLISVLLGRYAWPLVGKPDRDRGPLQFLP